MEKIIQITSGRGPAECCWVVAQVLKYLLEDAGSKGLSVYVLHKVNGDLDRTVVSATIQINGNSAQLETFLESWLGTIKWIGKSSFRKFHKRNNWFVGVNELNLKNESLKFNDNEIKYTATKAGGPGGQHVNKVSTAIRALHVPSGLFVLASDSRSQVQNKKRAKERLLNLLRAKQLETKKELIKANWQNHNELKRGEPIRVFKGSDFKNQVTKNKNKTDRLKARRELNNRTYDDD